MAGAIFGAICSLFTVGTCRVLVLSTLRISVFQGIEPSWYILFNMHDTKRLHASYMEALCLV